MSQPGSGSYLSRETIPFSAALNFEVLRLRLANASREAMRNSNHYSGFRVGIAGVVLNHLDLTIETVAGSNDKPDEDAEKFCGEDAVEAQVKRTDFLLPVISAHGPEPDRLREIEDTREMPYAIHGCRPCRWDKKYIRGWFLYIGHAGDSVEPREAQPINRHREYHDFGDPYPYQHEAEVLPAVLGRIAAIAEAHIYPFAQLAADDGNSEAAQAVSTYEAMRVNALPLYF